MSNGKIKIVAESIRGLYHLQNNLPNQDSFNFKVYKNLVVAAVADGMGSRKYSHIGSKKLTELVTKLGKNFYNKSFFEERLLKEWKRSIKPYKVDDCLSTLMFVIIKNNRVYIAKVGDGVIVVLGKKDKVLDDVKSFGNITVPFGLDKLRWWEFRRKEINTIFLATDGISDDIEKKIEFVKDFRDYFFKFNKKKELKNMLKNWPVRGSIDDKTLLCIRL